MDVVLRSKQLTMALQLQNEPIASRLLAYEAEYNNSEADELNVKVSYCFLARKALEGMQVKARSENFSCVSGAEAIGIQVQKPETQSGRTWKASGMYNDLAISKEIIHNSKHIPYKSFGVEFGPLRNMPEPDVAILLLNPKQCMRVMQGYAKYYGSPKNLNSVGFQAVCSDLFSQVLTNNDINISFMCSGARGFMSLSDDMMAVSFPVNMLENITDGVIETINLVEPVKVRNQLSSDSESLSELGINVQRHGHYSQNTAKYRKYVEKQEKL